MTPSWWHYGAQVTSDKGRLQRVLRLRGDLRHLLGANVVSQTGDWMLGVGLAFAVYDLTGSTLASAGTLLAAFLPQVLAGPVAGVFVDRWDRRRTMVAANVVMACVVLPLVLVTDAATVWVVFPVLVVQSLVEVFFAPAEQAMLPRLVPDDELVTANALNGQAGQVARLVGSALGGVAAAVGGVPAVALLDAASFLLAALLLSRIRTPGRVVTPAGEPDAAAVVSRRTHAFLTDLRTGVSVVRRSRALVVLLVFSVVTALGEGVMGVLFAPYVRDVLGADGGVYGSIMAMQAVGGLAGGAVAVVLAHRWGQVRTLGVTSVLFGLVDLVIFLYPLVLNAVWPALAGMLVVGLPAAFLSAAFLTVFQRSTRDETRGRAYSLVALARTCAVIVGSTTAGLLGERLGIMPVLAYQGVAYVLAGLVVLVALRESDA
jgi:MFS family permease